MSAYKMLFFKWNVFYGQFLVENAYIMKAPWLIHLCDKEKHIYTYIQSTETNAQHESCELSFTWGKIKTIAWKAAFQIALRNCSKDMGQGEYRIFVNLVKVGVHCNQAHIFAEGYY